MNKVSFIQFKYSMGKEKIQIGQYTINGTIIILGNNSEEGDFKALTKQQIQEFKKEFSISNTRVIEDEEIEF